MKNVIVIMTDEQRHDSLSCMGHPTLRTPNMDDLAADGFAFRNAFCASPLCVPSRVSFFTGQYVHRTLAVSNSARSHIKPSQLSLVELLKKRGYRIGLAGKNHTFDDAYMGKWFDFREEYSHFGKTHGTFTEGDRRVVEYLKDKCREGLIAGPAPFDEKDWMSSRIADDGIRFLEGCGRQPFFLYFSFPDPHWPNVVCEPYYSMYPPEAVEELEALDVDWSSHPFKQFVQSQVNGFDRYTLPQRKRLLATYYGQIAAVDRAMGRLLGKLRELALVEDTLVIFTADHGNFAGRYGLLGKTGAFFDALVRVPLVIRIPGMERGKTLDAEVSHIDVVPTLLECLGVDIPDGVQGKSLMPLLRGKTATHRSRIYAEVGMPQRPPEPVPHHEFKALNERMSRERGWQWFCDYACNGRSAMIRKGGWKYAYYVGDREELYDLAADPHEKINLADLPSHSGRKEEMKDELMDWLLTAPVSDLGVDPQPMYVGQVVTKTEIL